MTKINVTRVVKCDADHAYGIIADVRSYMRFLPFVRESRMAGREDFGEGQSQAAVTLRVGYKKLGLDESFVSSVKFDKPARRLEMKSKDGPLKHLDAVWTIKPLTAESCELTLKSDITLKSMTHQFLLSGLVDYVVRKLLTAFEERALHLQPAKT